MNRHIRGTGSHLKRTVGVVTRQEAGVAAVERWWPRLLLLLFVMSLGWKLFCLRRYLGSPLAGDLTGDSETYWLWARAIAQEGWWGRNPFFLGPLYPYWLAAWSPVTGTTLAGPLVLQCVLGSASAVLVAMVARSMCAPAFALVAGVLAAGCSMSTFMDISILSESLLWSLGAGFLYLQIRSMDHLPRYRVSAVTGVMVGLMMLGRPSFVLLLAPHVVASAARGGLRRGVSAALVAGACTLVVLLPVAYRHVRLGHGLIFSTYSLGYNAYVGNGPMASGAYIQMIDEMSADAPAQSVEGGIHGDGRAFIARREGLRLSPLESSAHWLRQTWAHIAESPSRWLRLLALKAALSVNHFEMSQIDNIRVRERLEGPMGLPLVGQFGFIGALGLYGLIAVGRSRAGQILLLHALAVWVPMLGFFVTDRYRFHLTLPLLVASAPAIEVAVRALRGARGGGAGIARVSFGVAAAAALVWLPLIRTADVQDEFQTHRTLGGALLRTGKVMEGERELQRCIDPALLARLPLKGSIASRSAVAEVLHTLASSYAERGEYLRSEQALRQALDYAPHVRSTRLDHAVLLAMLGRSVDAHAELDVLGIHEADLEAALLRVAERAVKISAWEPAEQALRAAIVVDSTREAANVILLRILVLQGRNDEAREHFSRFAGRGLHPSVIEREGRALPR